MSIALIPGKIVIFDTQKVRLEVGPLLLGQNGVLSNFGCHGPSGTYPENMWTKSSAVSAQCVLCI